MGLKPTICYRAVLARDARYDGRFFTCVKTTGIYCRPICPARPPKLANCRFVATAAAAQEAGFRPCLRCRPESSPDLDAWRGSSATVSRALKLVEAGLLDNGDVTSLADRLQIGERHLRRLFREHIGAAPVTVAQTRRVLLAKQLLHQTSLPMIQVALASGFGSVRRFNETFQSLYRRPPGDLRRHRAVDASPEISLLLPYQPPYHWSAMLHFLSARAIAGMEVVTEGRYRRVITIGESMGSITVTYEPDESALRVVVHFAEMSALPTIITRVRRMFDLSADPVAIEAALSADPLLRPIVKAQPGLRLPGAWDGFELAVRAVLGQQVTVKGATRLAGRLVAAIGRPFTDEFANGTLTHAFPPPANFKASAMGAVGLTKARAATLAHLARSAANDPTRFDPRGELDATITHLRTMPGIGEWAANYIAMRAMGETDAFLPGDVGVQRQLAVGGRRPSPARVLTMAERWRPWRAYAVMHLWMAASKNSRNFSKEVGNDI